MAWVNCKGISAPAAQISAAAAISKQISFPTLLPPSMIVEHLYEAAAPNTDRLRGMLRCFLNGV